MRIYKILIHGKGFKLKIDERLSSVGFYKPEFALAKSKRDANIKAITKIERRIKALTEAGGITPIHPIINCSETSVNGNLIDLIRKTGFAFYLDEP